MLQICQQINPDQDQIMQKIKKGNAEAGQMKHTADSTTKTLPH
jgi:hypothetical protein